MNLCVMLNIIIDVVRSDAKGFGSSITYIYIYIYMKHEMLHIGYQFAVDDSWAKSVLAKELIVC